MSDPYRSAIVRAPEAPVAVMVPEASPPRITLRSGPGRTHFRVRRNMTALPIVWAGFGTVAFLPCSLAAWAAGLPGQAATWLALFVLSWAGIFNFVFGGEDIVVSRDGVFRRRRLMPRSRDVCLLADARELVIANEDDGPAMALVTADGSAIRIGAGLRTSYEAFVWLRLRLQAAIEEARRLQRDE